MSFNTASYQNGYVQIPFTKIGVCHFSMEGSINDRAVSIMVNVGAPNTVVDLDLARDMNLPMMDLALLPNATSEPGEIYQVQSARFEIANFFPKFPALLAMDLSPFLLQAPLRLISSSGWTCWKGMMRWSTTGINCFA